MAQALYDFHMFSLYSHQRLHTDPQDGNYLLNKNQVVLLDFGSTREFSEDFLIDYVALLIAVERDDLKLYIKSCSQLGFFNEDDPIDLFEKHFKMVKTLYGPYNREGIYGLENTNPFKLIQDFVKDNTLKSLNMKNRSSIKEEFVLLDRANFGIFAKIKKLGAKIDWQKSKKLYRSRLDEKVRQKYSSYFNS